MGNLETEIRKDFEYELYLNKAGRIPFKKIILDNEDYKEALFKEFSKLTPEPKLYLYIRDFISDEEWAKDRAELWQSIPPSTGKNVMANPIRNTPLEKKWNDLSIEFLDLRHKGALDEKYNGRNLENTNTIQILKDIKNKIDDLEGFVFKSNNVDRYNKYAEAICKSIITRAEQLNISGLKNAILKTIIKEQENIKISTEHLLWRITGHNKRPDIKALEENYNILRTYFDGILEDELNKQPHSHKTKDKKNHQQLKSFIDFFKPEYKALPELLKNEFKTEVGKDIAIIIHVLKKREVILLGKLKPFVVAMNKYFGRKGEFKIGYEAVRKIKVLDTFIIKGTKHEIYQNEIDLKEKIIDSLIESAKNRKSKEK